MNDERILLEAIKNSMASVELADGEIYVGIHLNPDGICSSDGCPYHIILLRQEFCGVTFAEALEWAAKVGGVIPMLSDVALIDTNLNGREIKNSELWCCYADSSGKLGELGEPVVFSLDLGITDKRNEPGDIFSTARVIRKVPIKVVYS